MSTYWLTALLTLALVSLVVVQLVGAERPLEDRYDNIIKRQGSSKYCGKVLSNTLELICHGLYNSMFKRGDSESEMALDGYGDFGPLSTKAGALAMMHRLSARFRRQSRGVHDECCAKACSITELISYCATTAPSS